MKSEDISDADFGKTVVYSSLGGDTKMEGVLNGKSLDLAMVSLTSRLVPGQHGKPVKFRRPSEDIAIDPAMLEFS